MLNLRAALLDELKGVLNKKNPYSGKAEPINPIRHTSNIVSRPHHVKSQPKRVFANTNNVNNTYNTDSDFETFFGGKLLDYKSILPKNKRRVHLRNKYNCLLYSDIKYLKGIITQMRKWFYKQPVSYSSENKSVFGGIYIDYLQPRAHKTDKLYLINFRCESDLQLVDKVKSIASSYDLQCKIDYTLY